MKLSSKTDYALRVMLDLSANYPGKLAHIEEVAKRQDIPKKYLEQIFLLLKKGGFVESKKGPQGGYVLARHPKEISLGEVIRFLESLFFHSASGTERNRQAHWAHPSHAAFSGIWQEADAALSGVLDGYNFEDLKRRMASLYEKQTLNYCI